VQGLVADLPLDGYPKVGDFVTLDDADWKVLFVNTTFSGDLAAIHSLLLRR